MHFLKGRDRGYFITAELCSYIQATFKIANLWCQKALDRLRKL